MTIVINKKNIFLFFTILILQSCVIHFHKQPFICFSKKCVQAKREHRHFNAQSKKGTTRKLKSTKGERVKTNTKKKKVGSDSTANPSFTK